MNHPVKTPYSSRTALVRNNNSYEVRSTIELRSDCRAPPGNKNTVEAQTHDVMSPFQAISRSLNRGVHDEDILKLTRYGVGPHHVYNFRKTKTLCKVTTSEIGETREPN